MKKLIAILIIACTISSCGSGSNKTNNQEANLSQSPVEAYLNLKDALVQTNAQLAKEAANDFLKMNENTELNESLGIISNSNNVEEQRKAFETLSIKMYEIVKTEGSDDILYKQYCPMAFNNKGAFWLAAESEVNNPYFGDVMLHCGRVEETLRQ